MIERPRTLRPAIYLVRGQFVDRLAQAVEEALVDDGFYLLMDDERERSTRRIYLAQVTEAWLAVWDQAGVPAPGFPEGDPATSLARGMSAAGDAEVLYLWGLPPIWGYLLYKRGVTLDRFASDTRLFQAEVTLEHDDVDGMYRGRTEHLLPFLAPERTEEDLASSLISGDDSLLSFLEALGIPPSITLDAASLTDLEKDLLLTLDFAPRS